MPAGKMFSSRVIRNNQKNRSEEYQQTAIGFGCVSFRFAPNVPILGHIYQNASTQTPLVKSKPGL
jgi:hypothetical protein